MATSEEEKIVVLEEATPYDLSLKWKIQRRYYQERGKGAWIGGEVPYHITSTSAAARQRAILIYEAALAMEREGSLGRDEPIYVLELAGSVGIFALNCLDAFDDLDRERGLAYAPRIRYALTDYSERTLTDAAKVPAIQAARAAGRLDLFRVDALNPAELVPMPGSGPPPRAGAFVAVIANYLYCHLPMSILRKQKGELEEQRIKLSYPVPAYIDLDGKTLAISIDEPSLEAISKLVEEKSWAPPRPDFFDEPVHRAIVDELVRGFAVATIPYPRGSFRSLAATLPMLRDGGIVVITDKGFSDVVNLEGEHDCAPSLHGNAFAHSLNFAIVARYAEALGGSTHITDTPDFSLQTLLVEKRAKPALASVFAANFVDRNINVDAMDFYDVGTKHYDVKMFGAALRFLHRALVLARPDLTLLYYIGSCHFSRGEYDLAFENLSRGAELDRFEEVNFESKLGGCRYLQERYEEAIVHYERALKHPRGAIHITLYNLGRAKERLGDRRGAAESYRRSTAANPFDTDAANALAAMGPV